MQYVELIHVRSAANALAFAEKMGDTIACEYEVGDTICGEPAEYLVPNATRSGGGGQDIEQRPAMFCREHLEELLGHPPEEQPIFRRLRGPDE
jgi:hypothetical protein